MRKFSPEAAAINGLLLVDKPEGFTSHDVVDAIRRRFRFKKVGHTGTLDPLATGLLVITLGKATKLTNRLSSQSKDYLATCRLGFVSDTQDAQGRILEEKPVTVSKADIREVVSGFRGEQDQIPPMFSAKKQDGKKLYELARSGVVVEREPKKITIFDIQIDEIKENEFTFFVSCSKGTYVRTLCHDIGERLGCGGLLHSLRRIRSGSFKIEEAHALDALLESDLKTIKSRTLPLEDIETDESLQAI